MSAIQNNIKGFLLGAALTVGAVVLTPIVIPVAMAVGLVAAPIFATKALYHKISWNASKKVDPLADQATNASKKVDPLADQATIDKNQLKALEQEKEMIQSLDKAKSFAICIIPFGFLSELMTSRSSPRVTELTEQIANLEPRGNS